MGWGRGKGYSWGLGLTLLCTANPSYSNNFIIFGFAYLQGTELFVGRKNLTRKVQSLQLGNSLLFFRNALSLAMLDTLKSNLLHNVDSNLRVIILSANGGVFSSGHDLKELVRRFKICNKQIAFLGW